MKKILVIEDEFQIRDNIREVLELQGFSPLLAENGRIGLKMAQTLHPDLILCDIMMPEMDGYRVLQELRQQSQTAMIPFIFLTAKSDRMEQRQGMELGADDYLTKPFSTGELIRAIATRLERQQRFTEPYQQEYQQAQFLKREVQVGQEQLQKSQDLSDAKTDLLKKLSQELRDPLSNINMAIHMLKNVREEADRDRYLAILQEECAREIQLLNEMDYLQSLLTPENIRILQRFKLMN